MRNTLLAGMPVAVKLGLPLAAAALVASACSSSTGSQSGYGAAGSAAAPGNTSASPVGSAQRTVIKTAPGAEGRFLTDGSGRTLYLWAADSSNESTCADACAGAWPPLTVTGTPTASGGASAADIGTITRGDGRKQVTYNGHALYYFVGDTSAGQTGGQGSDAYGAEWWLVAPSGSKITTGDDSE